VILRLSSLNSILASRSARRRSWSGVAGPSGGGPSTIAAIRPAIRVSKTARSKRVRSPKRRNRVPLPTPAAAATSSIVTVSGSSAVWGTGHALYRIRRAVPRTGGDDPVHADQESHGERGHAKSLVVSGLIGRIQPFVRDRAAAGLGQDRGHVVVAQRFWTRQDQVRVHRRRCQQCLDGAGRRWQAQCSRVHAHLAGVGRNLPLRGRPARARPPVAIRPRRHRRRRPRLRGRPAARPLQVADLLVQAGAVRGMQLDINPSWPVFASFKPATPDGLAAPSNCGLVTGRACSPSALPKRGRASWPAPQQRGAAARSRFLRCAEARQCLRIDSPAILMP
jgi:hypothetical protein